MPSLDVYMCVEYDDYDPKAKEQVLDVLERMVDNMHETPWITNVYFNA